MTPGPKFPRTVLTVEVLGRDEAFEGDLEDLAKTVIDGPFSGRVLSSATTLLPPAEMAAALAAQGSDPSFLGLSQDGTNTDEWDD